MKLLLVEDNPTMQTTLQRSLSRRGMEVATCGDGGLALEKWPEFQPDVVVLDLTLPGLDGLQVLQRARGCAKRAMQASHKRCAGQLPHTAHWLGRRAAQALNVRQGRQGWARRLRRAMVMSNIGHGAGVFVPSWWAQAAPSVTLPHGFRSTSHY